MPYEEQLKRKEEELKKSLKKMASYLSKPEWMPVSLISTLISDLEDGIKSLYRVVTGTV